MRRNQPPDVVAGNKVHAGRPFLDIQVHDGFHVFHPLAAQVADQLLGLVFDDHTLQYPIPIKLRALGIPAQPDGTRGGLLFTNRLLFPGWPKSCGWSDPRH